MPAELQHGTQTRATLLRRGSQRATLLAGWVIWLGVRLTVMALARDSHPIPPTRPSARYDNCHKIQFSTKRSYYNPLTAVISDDFVLF